MPKPIVPGYLVLGNRDTAASRKKSVQNFMSHHYPNARLTDRADLFESWRSALKQMRTASACPPTQRSGVQFTIGARAKLNQPWYWPLEIVASTPESLAAAERHAREEDEENRRYFKTDPLYFFNRTR